MTLIEVLASVVLLAALAAATLPWITDARRLSKADTPSMTPETLGDLADAALQTPAEFGLPPLLEITATPLTLYSMDGKACTIRRIDAQADEPTHAWLIFESADHMTARQIRLPKEPAS